jgi:hypothetical protein
MNPAVMRKYGCSKSGVDRARICPPIHLPCMVDCRVETGNNDRLRILLKGIR